MPGTFDAGYVVGAVLGDGSIIRDTKRDGTCGYYVVLAVRDVAFAERFRRHVSACMGRKPWIKSYVVRRKGNPDIGMPPTIATEWHVKVGSREWYDLLSPYKHGREFGGLPARSEEFRKGFLQGIFDSEGYIGPTGYRDIAGKDMDLLRVVKSVLESLGEKAAIYGPYPYSRGVAHLRTTTKLQKTTVRAE
jgi:intein-encoded DNA endonuclease-like protein